MIRRNYFWLLLVAFAGTALWATAQSSEDEMRRKLEAYQKRPELLQRLRDNYQAFQSLTEERKNAVIKLDTDLHTQNTKRQERYATVLARYADWLDRLKKRDPQAYQKIKNAPDGAARLALIKAERDREWLLTQPKAHREKWDALPLDERDKYIISLREEERTKHLHWQISARFWRELEAKQPMPCRLSDFGTKLKDPKVKDKDGKLREKEVNKVQNYVQFYLMPFLTDAEKKKLDSAEGNWPDYPMALVEIASKHPSALPPPRKEDLPTEFSKLPTPIQEKLLEKKVAPKMRKELKNYEKREEFPGKFIEICAGQGLLPFEHEFWASNHKSLLKPMQDFVDKDLKTKLDEKEKADLQFMEGKWPYYPQKIQELAKKHNLQAPWHILPEEDKWHWDRYRRDRGPTPMPEKAKETEDP
jgi:hypothetical protein